MSVGIPEIDEEHQTFIHLVNELNRVLTERTNLEEIRNKIQLLINDVILHFTHEERLFKEWHYPDADDHASKHADIINTLEDVNALFFTSKCDSHWIDAGLKISVILISHILNDDMKYAGNVVP